MTVPCACGLVAASSEAWAKGPRVALGSDLVHSLDGCAGLNDCEGCCRGLGEEGYGDLHTCDGSEEERP